MINYIINVIYLIHKTTQKYSKDTLKKIHLLKWNKLRRFSVTGAIFFYEKKKNKFTEKPNNIDLGKRGGAISEPQDRNPRYKE